MIIKYWYPNYKDVMFYFRLHVINCTDIYVVLKLPMLWLNQPPYETFRRELKLSSYA